MKVSEKIRKELRANATPERAKASAWFFKTGPGEYAEGDRFIGVTSPDMRKVVKKFASHCSRVDTTSLLCSPIHEERQVALLMMVKKFQAGDGEMRQNIFKDYLAHTRYINNWDLVDLSAGHIVGGYLADKDKKILIKLAKSKNIWERRIAMIATFHEIYAGRSEETFRIARILLHDTHDLIHKAVGWMLREVGKRVSEKELRTFLDQYAHDMPRTMLRYAIERLPEQMRQYYLKQRKRTSVTKDREDARN